MWIGTYPQDFIQEGTADALLALLGDLNVNFDLLDWDVLFQQLLPTFPTSLATWHANGTAGYRLTGTGVQRLCFKLVFIASIVDSLNNSEIAQEITRMGVELFLKIEVSDT